MDLRHKSLNTIIYDNHMFHHRVHISPSDDLCHVAAVKTHPLFIKTYDNLNYTSLMKKEII